MTEHERVPPSQLWSNELRPFQTCLQDEGDGAWEAIAAEYDQYAVREFLELRGWSEGAIEMFGLLFNQEALMNSSFLELLREEVGDYYTNLLYLDGGTDLLPRAFLPDVGHRVRFGAKMIALEQSPDDVTVHYRTGAGRFSVTGDFAIVTVPFPVLRHVEVLSPFSRPKQRAIRQLHYDASAKVFLQFRRRFWEDDDEIFGGGSVTDLAVRNVYYPDHGRDTGRGVVLASYTWGEDAQRWGSLTPEDRLVQALEDVTRIHPRAPRTTRSVPPRCGTTTSSPAARSRCSTPGSRRSSSMRSARPRGGSTSRASTRRWPTRGSRVRSSRGCAPRPRSTTGH